MLPCAVEGDFEFQALFDTFVRLCHVELGLGAREQRCEDLATLVGDLAPDLIELGVLLLVGELKRLVELALVLKNRITVPDQLTVPLVLVLEHLVDFVVDAIFDLC